MSEKFTFEIISPDSTILKIETNEVVIPAFEGEIGILKDHVPLITFLRPGLIKTKENSENSFFVENGTVEFSNNNLLILTSTAIELSKLDKNIIEKMIKEAEAKVENGDFSDKDRYLQSHKISTLKSIN